MHVTALRASDTLASGENQARALSAGFTGASSGTRECRRPRAAARGGRLPDTLSGWVLLRSQASRTDAACLYRQPWLYAIFRTARLHPLRGARRAQAALSPPRGLPSARAPRRRRARQGPGPRGCDTLAISRRVSAAGGACPPTPPARFVSRCGQVAVVDLGETHRVRTARLTSSGFPGLPCFPRDAPATMSLESQP